MACSFIDRVICRPHNSGGVLSFHVFYLLFVLMKYKHWLDEMLKFILDEN